MRGLLKTLVVLVGAVLVTRLASVVIAKQFEAGSEVSDELRRLVVLDGLDFVSRAGGLRSAEIGVALGGVRVDLREATLDPDGATVVLENTLGGMLLIVREDWAVSVDDTLLGGGESLVEVTPPTDLPDDAPRLEVKALTRLGGTVVTNDASRYGGG